MKKVLVLILTVFSVVFVGAAEVTLRVMPSPQTPEADFAAEGTGGWDVGVGYGHLWLKDSDSATLDGAVAGVLYRGVIGDSVGYTISPLFGGMYFGELEGYKADSYSVGAGFSFGSRLVGRPESSNVILFGGGLYSYAMDRNDNEFGSYRLDAHFFGFSAGMKTQVALARFVRIIPFYVYLGGGGRYSSLFDPVLPLPIEEIRGGLGYHDAHLLGLDFNIYGVSAKIVADLFRDDFRSFTIWVEIGKTVRGIKRVTGAHKQPETDF